MKKDIEINDLIQLKSDGSIHRVTNIIYDLFDPLTMEIVNAILVDCNGEERKVANNDIKEIFKGDLNL